MKILRLLGFLGLSGIILLGATHAPWVALLLLPLNLIGLPWAIDRGWL
jgi:hypothetical protein